MSARELTVNGHSGTLPHTPIGTGRILASSTNFSVIILTLC